MNKPITRKKAIALFGFTTYEQLADHLGISRQAVQKWPANGPIPKQRQWQIEAMISKKSNRKGSP